VGVATEDDLVNALSEQERYCNHVFKCLVTVICRTQNKAQFFDKWIFGNFDLLHVLVPSRRNGKSEVQFTTETQFRTSESSMNALAYAFKRKGAFGGSNMSSLSRCSAFDLLSSVSQSQMLLPSLEIPPGLRSMAVLDVRAQEDDERFKPKNKTDAYNGGASTATTQALPQTMSTDQGDDKNKDEDDEDDMFDDEEDPYEDDEDEDGLYGEQEDPVLRDCISDETESLEMDALNRLPVMNALLTGIDTLRAKDLLGHAITREGFKERGAMYANCSVYFPGSGVHVENSDKLPSFVAMIASGLCDQRSVSNDKRATLNMRLLCCKVRICAPMYATLHD
jgi:hypothetical protein